MSERQLCSKCERCHDDGLRDDEECPWYGEPCGCNHPERGVSRDIDSMHAEIESLRTENTRLRAALAEVLGALEGDPEYSNGNYLVMDRDSYKSEWDELAKGRENGND